MRKILAIIICTLCLSFPVAVQADDNVTNQLNEITAQLENLDQVLQWFVDNQENLDWWVDMGFWDEYLSPSLFRYVQQHRELVQIGIVTEQAWNLLATGIVPDIATIKNDLAALSADLAGYVSQIVNSINGVSSEVMDLHMTLRNIERYMLYFDQHNEYLHSFLSSLPDILSDLPNYSYTLSQILQAIQSMDYSDQVEAALYNISQALNNLGQISVVVDLGEEIENLDINFDLDLGTALSRLEGDLGSVLAEIKHISYVLQNFVYIVSDFIGRQDSSNDELSIFLHWYTDTFFPGLRTVLSSHNVWLERQEALEDAEDEHREKLEAVFTDDTTMPTDSDTPVEVLLEAVDIDEPEEPDYKIEQAQDKVETDMEEVSSVLDDAMGEVDAEFSAFIDKVNFTWGSFNSVLSFSFSPPRSQYIPNYTMNFSYDFSKSDLRAPCRAASTGIWGIVLFVQSFLAISETLHSIIEN